MHYCINSLLEINNEIMQYCIIINDIALIMHYRALLKGSGLHQRVKSTFFEIVSNGAAPKGGPAERRFFFQKRWF